MLSSMSFRYCQNDIVKMLSSMPFRYWHAIKERNYMNQRRVKAIVGEASTRFRFYFYASSIIILANIQQRNSVYASQCLIQFFSSERAKNFFAGGGEVLFSGGQMYNIKRKNCNFLGGGVNLPGGRRPMPPPPPPRWIKHCAVF